MNDAEFMEVHDNGQEQKEISKGLNSIRGKRRILKIQCDQRGIWELQYCTVEVRNSEIKGFWIHLILLRKDQVSDIVECLLVFLKK